MIEQDLNPGLTLLDFEKDTSLIRKSSTVDSLSRG